jgi:hypothetical protein
MYIKKSLFMSIVKSVSKKYISNSYFYHIDFNDRATYTGTFSFNTIVADNGIKSKISQLAQVLSKNNPAPALVDDKITLRMDNANGNPNTSRITSILLEAGTPSNISLLMAYQIEDKNTTGSSVWLPDLYTPVVPVIDSSNVPLECGSLAFTYNSTSVYNTATFSFSDFAGFTINYFLNFNLDIRKSSGTVNVTTDGGSIVGLITNITWNGADNQTVNLQFSNSIPGCVYDLTFTINYLYEFPLIFIGSENIAESLFLSLDYSNNKFSIPNIGTIPATTELSELKGFVVIGFRTFGNNIVEFSVNGVRSYLPPTGNPLNSQVLNLGWIPNAIATDLNDIYKYTTSYNVGEVIYVTDAISDLDWKELNAYLVDKWQR